MANLPSPILDNDKECHVIILENEPYNRSQCTSPGGYSFTRPRSVNIMEAEEISHPGDVNNDNKHINGILKKNIIPDKNSIQSNLENDKKVLQYHNRLVDILPINTKIDLFINFLKKYKYIIGIIIFILLLLLVIGLSISLGIIAPLAKLFCTSKACLSLSKQFGEIINRNEDICKNPYIFTCGNILEWDNIDDYLNEFNNKPYYFIENIKIIQDDIIGILNTMNNGTLSYKISKSLYDGCINNMANQNEGIKSLRDLISSLPCGPILNNCITFHLANYSMEKNIGSFGFYGGELNIIYYDEDIDPDYGDNVILSFSPPDLTSFLEPYKRKVASTEFDNADYRRNLLIFAIKDLYIKCLTEVLNVTKFNNIEIEEVANFTVQLENFTTRMKGYDNDFKILTINDLNMELGDFDLFNFLNSDISNQNTWNGTNRVLVNNIGYFKNLDIFLKTFTPKIIANYLSLISSLNLVKFVDNPIEGRTTWRKCINDIRNIETTVKIFYDKYGISESAENNFKKLFIEFRNYYVDTHKDFTLELITKLNNMNIQVGVPPQMKNENTIDEMYSKVHVNSSDYFNSMIRILKRRRDYRILNIGSTMDSRNNVHWEPLYPEIVYDEHENTLFIPLALLKLPIIDSSSNDNWITRSSLGFLFFQKLAEISFNSAYENGYKESFFNCLNDKSSIGSFGSSASRISQNTLQNTDALQTVMMLMSKKNKEIVNENVEPSNIPGYTDFSLYQLAIIQASSFMCYKNDPINIAENMVNEQSFFNTLNEMKKFNEVFKCSEVSINDKSCYTIYDQ